MVNFFLFFSFSLLFYIVFLRRRFFDFFTIFVLFFLYNYCVVTFDVVDFGGFSYTSLAIAVPFWLKLYILIFSLSLSILILVYDFLVCKRFGRDRLNEESSSNGKEKVAVKFFLIPLVLLLIYLVLFNGGDLLGSKMDVKFQQGGVIALIAGFSQVVFFLSLRRNFIPGLLVSFFVVVIFLIIGSRANILFFILIFVLHSFNGKMVRVLSLKHSATIFTTGVVLSLLLSVKLFYKNIKSGEIGTVLTVLQSVDFSLLFDLLLVEPKAVVMNFITLVENVDYGGNVGYLFFAPIPFLSDLYRRAFSVDVINTSTYLKDNFYLVDFGLASSIFGEVYAFFGAGGLFFFTVFVFVLLAVSSWMWIGCRNLYFLIHVPTLIILFSYMHRTALFNFLSSFKVPLLLCSLLAFWILLARTTSQK
ncbi:hypothetical protein [Rheinheimera sp.]|uniref:hypothetical protein n=1 Tax=Rheinheimera sp. TaxID=1869214 RepID=UPI0027355E2C|nr:hypothetical protein [Rheinheimera sp.]MDP2715681.1 hypothetical protein [Rheinheimera sp.]